MVEEPVMVPPLFPLSLVWMQECDCSYFQNAARTIELIPILAPPPVAIASPPILQVFPHGAQLILSNIYYKCDIFLF